MRFRHLNYLQRCQILAFWKAGFNQTRIANELGVYKSTICLELKRNLNFVHTSLGSWAYKPDYAQTYAKERRQATRYYYKFTLEVEEYVREKLQQAVLSAVERVSKFTLLKKLNRKTRQLTTRALVDGLGQFKQHVHTLTSDNGSEFAGHETVRAELEADFFFAHPYSSWERGLNENTNGLVRQYLKKSSVFTHINEDVLAIIADKLNNRPRKNLGYKTPEEVFFGV